MARLKNRRWEAFAQAMANGGIKGAQAYREHISEGKCSPATAWAGASALLRCGHVVAIRIEELRALADTLAEERLIFSKVELLQWLSGVMRTAISEVDASSNLVQEFSEVTKDGGTMALHIRMVDKVAAGRLLAEMCGWHREASHTVPEAVPEGPRVDIAALAAKWSQWRPAMDSITGEKSLPEVVDIDHPQGSALELVHSPLLHTKIVGVRGKSGRKVAGQKKLCLDFQKAG